MAGYNFDPQNYEELQNIIDFASAMVATPFDASKSYAVGEYCRRESGFYVCNTSGSGAWDASKWTPTTVGDVLKAANAEISAINSNLTQFFKTSDVTITVTIGSGGYTSIASYAPAVPSGYTLFMVVCLGIGSITSKDAFTVEADGGYVYGTRNATINGMLLRYIYVRSAVM